MTVKPIGTQIRDARERLAWSQSELAEKAGCTRQHISNLEVGKQSPTIEILMLIQRALGTKLHVPEI